MEKCPKCQINVLHEEKVRNALSRKDNKTYICNDCGLAEAMADYVRSSMGFKKED